VIAGSESLRLDLRWMTRVIAASMVLMFAVVAVPWALRMIDVDLAPLAWTLTAYAVFHAAIVIGSERTRSHAAFRGMLHAVAFAGAASMTILWEFGGGIGHPALVLIMVLPVAAAAALPRPWFAYAVAAYSIITTTVAVALTSADFTWYLTQLFPAFAGFGVATQELGRDPFPGASTTPAAAFVFVATFAVLQLAAAVAATTIARFIRDRRMIAGEPLLDPDVLAVSAQRAIPAAAATVISSTGQIVSVSRIFEQQMLLHHASFIGREIYEFVDFADLDAARQTILHGGSLRFCRYRIGSEIRIGTLVATTFTHGGIEYTSLVITDFTDAAWLSSAAEEVPEPLLVIGSDGRLRYANRAARTIFDELYAGREMTPILGDWWTREPRQHRVEAHSAVFDATATPVRLFGSDAATLLTMRRAEDVN
jgi:PAS domain-containing protein